MKNESAKNVGKKICGKREKKKTKWTPEGGRDSDGVVDDEGVAQQTFLACITPN